MALVMPTEATTAKTAIMAARKTSRNSNMAV